MKLELEFTYKNSFEYIVFIEDKNGVRFDGYVHKKPNNTLERNSYNSWILAGTSLIKLSQLKYRINSFEEAFRLAKSIVSPSNSLLLCDMESVEGNDVLTLSLSFDGGKYVNLDLKIKRLPPVHSPLLNSIKKALNKNEYQYLYSVEAVYSLNKSVRFTSTFVSDSFEDILNKIKMLIKKC